MFDDYAKLGDLFEDLSKVCYDLADLDRREEEGEDVTELQEAALGKLMVKMMKMQAMSK